MSSAGRANCRAPPNIDPEQRYILGQMVRYLKHPSSGVKTFDRMNKEWKDVVQKVRMGMPMTKTADEVRATVGAWHQEQRDICLLMTRKLGVPVTLKMKRKEKDDPEHRLNVDGQTLAQNHLLTATLEVPDAAAPIDVTIDLARRTVGCSMRIAAPSDKKSTKARLNWLLRQLPKDDVDGIQITAEWPGRAMDTYAMVSALREDINAIVGDNASRVPGWLRVCLIRDLAGKFSGRKTFIETVEATIPDFYIRVGQRLKAWVPAPPKLHKQSRPVEDEPEERVREASVEAAPEPEESVAPEPQSEEPTPSRPEPANAEPDAPVPDEKPNTTPNPWFSGPPVDGEQ